MPEGRKKRLADARLGRGQSGTKRGRRLGPVGQLLDRLRRKRRRKSECRPPVQSLSAA